MRSRKPARLALRHQHIDLPELGDDLLRLVLLLGHSLILQMVRKPDLGEDHFSGGRPFIAAYKTLSDLPLMGMGSPLSRLDQHDKERGVP